MVDTRDLKSLGHCGRAGSSPASGTKGCKDVLVEAHPYFFAFVETKHNCLRCVSRNILKKNNNRVFFMNISKTIWTVCIIGIFCPFVLAQETAVQEEPSGPWKVGGNASFTFNQISFKNWAAGGKNSVSGTFLNKITANYKSESATWDNTLDLGYGLMKYSSEDYQKSEDKIFLQSIYGYDAAKQKLFYSASFDFKTQFAKGYKYGADTVLVSKGFAPAYLNLSLGMLYKPADWFSFYLSPLTARFTIVSDCDRVIMGDPNAPESNTTLGTYYGLDRGDNVRSEYGASAKLKIDKKGIVKNVDFYLRADLFSNLTDHPEHIDVDAETGLNLNVNDWLTAVVKVNLLFDDDIKYVESYTDENGDVQSRKRGARVQCKELFGFGLQFKWGK